MGSRANSTTSLLNSSTDRFYLRLTFRDRHLSSSADPDARVIHTEEYARLHGVPRRLMRLRAFGETRKKAKDLVVSGTQFLMNTTEKIGSSFMSLVNTDATLNDGLSPKQASLPNSPSSGAPGNMSDSSNTLLSKLRVKHIPIV